MSLTIDTTIKATTIAHPTQAAGICILDAQPGQVVTLLDTIPSNPAGGRQWSVEYWPSNLTSAPSVASSTANPATFTIPQEGGFQILLKRFAAGPVLESEHRIFIGVPHTDGNTIPCAGLDSDLINTSEEANSVGWAGGHAESNMLEAVVRKARDDIESFGEMIDISGTVLKIGQPATDITIGATAGDAPIAVVGESFTIKAVSGLQGMIVLPDFGGGGGTIWAFGADNQAAAIGCLTPETPGPNVGTGLQLSGGDGREANPSDPNNPGLPVVIRPGKPGTGGTGDPGTPGPVVSTPDEALYPVPDTGYWRLPHPEPWEEILIACKNFAGNATIPIVSVDNTDTIKIGDITAGDIVLSAGAGKQFVAAFNNTPAFVSAPDSCHVAITGAMPSFYVDINGIRSVEILEQEVKFGPQFNTFQFDSATTGPIVFWNPGGSSDWMFQTESIITIRHSTSGPNVIAQSSDVSLNASNSTIAVTAADVVSIYGDDKVIVSAASKVQETAPLIEKFSGGQTSGTTGIIVEGKNELRSSKLTTPSNTPTVLFTLTLPSNCIGLIKSTTLLKSGANAGATHDLQMVKCVSGTATINAHSYLAATSASLVSERDAALSAAVCVASASGSTIVWTVTGPNSVSVDWQLYLEVELLT